MRGRRPKPTALKVIAGNPGRRPLNKREPKPGPTRLRPPKRLSADARTAWKVLAPMLKKLNVISEADVVALEGTCEAFADLARARRELGVAGWYQTVTTKAGGTMIRLHPAAGVAQDADRRLRAWLAEFGITPSSRSRVSTVPDEDTRNPFAEFAGPERFFR